MIPTDAAKLLLESKANLSDGHRKNWQAVGNMRKAENALTHAGMILCPTCLGHGKTWTQVEPKTMPCDWCAGTGYDDERHKTCWKCRGEGEFAVSQFEAHTCGTCNGSRVIPCKEKRGV